MFMDMLLLFGVGGLIRGQQMWEKYDAGICLWQAGIADLGDSELKEAVNSNRKLLHLFDKCPPIYLVNNVCCKFGIYKI